MPAAWQESSAGACSASRLDSPEARQDAGLGVLARVFLTLGTIGFGGPAAHIALMREEVVRRRGWLSDQQFLDLIGATNLIPGPNSTEMAMHVGSVRAGFTGLVVAGACFIAPAALIVGALAALYVRYGTTPEAGWHHDGRFNLADLVRMVEIEASAERAADRLAPYAQEDRP